MKKFYLFCNNGMSTSMLAQGMQDCARSHNLDLEVKAFSISVMPAIVTEEHPDCILLGPQVGHLLKDAEKSYAPTPVMVIDKGDYGRMLGETVLKKAIKVYKSGQKK